MAEVKALVQRLEESLRQYGTAFEVLHYLTTADERRVSVYQALIETEELVNNLSDNRLKSLFQRVVDGQRSTTVRGGAVLAADYSAFYGRLIKLANDECIKANETQIELKQALGLDFSSGIWGPKGWRPPGA